MSETKPNLPTQDPAYQQAMAETYEERARLREEQLDHLANWVCNIIGRENRQKFMRQFEKRHGEALSNDLRERVRIAWQAAKEAEASARDA